MTTVSAAFPALMCFMVFTSSVIAVQQSWGDFAMPQRQTDVALTGLQAGNFSAFTDGVVRETVITIQDLASVPYTVVDIGSGQLCPANTTDESFPAFIGCGLAQDDDLNLYATVAPYTFGISTTLWTIKLSRGVDDEFIPQWVTCTSNNDSQPDNGNVPPGPALYKDANEDTFVIVRVQSTQYALRASDGALEHSMEGSFGNSYGVAITPDGVVLHPGSGLNDSYIASTDEPLSGTNFTLTTDQGLSPPRDLLRTMGSPNSFVGFDPDDGVAFFDNLGQTSATTFLNTSFGDILKISGLKDGRVVVLHTNQSEGTLTIVDYDGTNRVDIVFSDSYAEPDDESECVCEGADGHVYVQDTHCNLYRVDIDSLSTVKINYTGIGDCFLTNLAANDEGVFFVTSNSSFRKRGPPPGGPPLFVAEFDGLQYGNSAIEQLGNRISLQQPFSFISFGYTVPGAQVGLVVSNFGFNFSAPQPIIVVAAFNVEEVSSESADSDSDAASGLSSIFSGVF